MVTIDSMDAARTLTYRFLDLSHVSRIEIVQQLGLYMDEDEGIRDEELLERVYKRADESKKLERLWTLVEERHDDGSNITNPFVGR